MGWGEAGCFWGGTVEVGTVIDFIALCRFPSSSCQEKKKKKEKSIRMVRKVNFKKTSLFFKKYP